MCFSTVPLASLHTCSKLGQSLLLFQEWMILHDLLELKEPMRTHALSIVWCITITVHEDEDNNHLYSWCMMKTVLNTSVSVTFLCFNADGRCGCQTNGGCIISKCFLIDGWHVTALLSQTHSVWKFGRLKCQHLNADEDLYRGMSWSETIKI